VPNGDNKINFINQNQWMIADDIVAMDGSAVIRMI
jgi:hypothetical protein